MTWYCVSPEGCERVEEVTRIDRVTVTDFFYLHFTSAQDESFEGVDAQMIESDTLGFDCYAVFYLSLFGHELEPSRLCIAPGGFDIELSIPNQDPATHSKWVITARDLSLQ